jgi:hypothetical protein
MPGKSKRSRRADSPPPQPRFEATVHPGAADTPLSRVADLGLDRLPDPQRGVRLLVNTDDLIRLLDEGYEVRLHHVVPVQPLSPDLIMGDADARRWLEDQVAGIARSEGGDV